MTEKFRSCYHKELDYALGYFTVFSKDNFYICPDCPPEIRKRLEEDWPRIKRETEERQKNGDFYGSDYF